MKSRLQLLPYSGGFKHVSCQMLRSRRGTSGVALLAVALTGLPVSSACAGERLSGPLSLVSSTAAGDSLAPQISGDGRFVVFTSAADDLVVDDMNQGKTDVFVRELQTGRTELVSVAIDGGSGDGGSRHGIISRDGRWVAFVSAASNLVAGDTNRATDVFLRDRQLGITVRVSESVSGGAADGDSEYPVLTPDGRFVGFESRASNLVNGDTNGVWDVFVRDLGMGTTRWLSAPAADVAVATLPAGDSSRLVLADDGQTALFVSASANIAPAVVVGTRAHTNDLILVRGAGGAARRVSIFRAGLNQGVSVSSRGHALSADGASLAFLASSTAETVVTNGLYWVDAESGAFVRISPSWQVLPPVRFEDQIGPSMAAQAGWVLFSAPDLETAALGGARSVWVWSPAEPVPRRLTPPNPVRLPTTMRPAFGLMLGASRDGGTVVCLGRAPEDATAANGPAMLVVRVATGETRVMMAGMSGGRLRDFGAPMVSVSDDGARVAFVSRDTGLVTGDANDAADVFVYEWESGRLECVSLRGSEVRGTTGTGASYAGRRAVSADGRFVAYATVAPVAGVSDTNGVTDVAVYDVVLGRAEVVSVGLDGLSTGDRASAGPVLSADGRFVAFTSFAGNLVEGMVAGEENVFLRDRWSGTTTWVSRRANLQAASGPSAGPALSADGRWAAFHSRSRALGPADGNTTADIYLYDRETSGVAWLSTNAPGRSALAADSMNPVFSADGRWLAFESLNEGLLAVSGVSGGRQVILRELATGASRPLGPLGGVPVVLPRTLSAAEPVVFSADGRRALSVRFTTPRELWLNELVGEGAAQLVATNAALGTLSGDGRWVAYSVRSPDGGGLSQVRVFDSVTRSDELVSAGPGGEEGDGASDSPVITEDGRFVVYCSRARNLTGAADATGRRLLLRDRVRGTTVVLDAGGGAVLGVPVLAADGRTVIFMSAAGDATDFNQREDVFAVRLPATESNFRIAAVLRMDRGRVRLIWAVEAGRQYRVEMRTGLEGPWVPADAAVTVQGSQAWAEPDAAEPGTSRFYRLVTLAP